MSESDFDFGDEAPGGSAPGEMPEQERSLLGRSRSWAKIALMVVAVFLIVIGASALVTNIFESRRSTTQRFGDAVERLVVTAGNGEIIVTAASGTEIVIERDERYVFRRPSRVADLEGSTLVLDDGCPSFNMLFLGGCRVNFRITVPPGTSIDLDSSNGDLVVEGITGGAVLRTSNGDIDLDRLTGEIDARTSNGAIVGRGLRSAAVDVDTSNGRISLVFEAPPDRVAAETDNGPIYLEVPDLAYRIDADTANGDIDLEVVSDPDATRTIEVESSNGDIEIRRR